jgi:hypothetical protein
VTGLSRPPHLSCIIVVAGVVSVMTETRETTDEDDACY